MLRASVAPLLLALGANATGACGGRPAPPGEPRGQIPTAVTTASPEWLPFAIRAGTPVEGDARERRLRDLRQLTFDGENLEGTWSPDGTRIAFRTSRAGGCDQVHVMDLATGATRRVSPGAGSATDAAFLPPDGDRLLFATTHAASPACPPRGERGPGELELNPHLDLYAASLDGSGLAPWLVSPGYDGDIASSPDGTRLVFSTARDGDVELYSARADGTEARRVTDAAGYDGDASFSPDARRLVWVASRPAVAVPLEEQRAELARGVVRPAPLEVHVADAEGQNARAVTRHGRVCLSPVFLPDGRRVLYTSSHADPRGRDFDLYLVDADRALSDGFAPAERVTFQAGFDGFGAFSPDGRHLLFSSTRGARSPGEANLFVARWAE